MRPEYVIIIVIIFVIYRFVIRPFRQGLKSGSSKKIVIKEPVKTVNKKPFPKKESEILTPQEKGKKFEDFVVRRFQSEKFYKLKEWRGDKYLDGIYPESSTYPDLELEFSLKDIKRRFAIECKYRSKSYDGIVEFAEKRQLTTYKNFEKENKIPVYILLGFGGQPHNPSELFLIPIVDIYVPYMEYSQLKEYQKDLTGHFYYNLLDDSLN